MVLLCVRINIIIYAKRADTTALSFILEKK